ncbi:MAG: hypothetical protein Q9163_002005 [Psora crenata]
MNDASPRPVARSRRSRSRSVHADDGYDHGRPNGSVFRRPSNISNPSFASDVEMAHDEVFAGPISESVPSSVTGFAHQRPRSDSVTSYTYFQEADDSPDWSEDQGVLEVEEGSTDASRQTDSSYEYDLEANSLSSKRRNSSAYSRHSVEDPLLRRRGSSKSETSALQKGYRISQKIYIVSEDLTVVVAGFGTRKVGFALYLVICTLTLGLGYLVFRWLPQWKVYIVGSSMALKDCDWVVIEDQWGDMTVQNLKRMPYGHALSTVFGPKALSRRSSEYEDDDDPILREICFLDYRYIRLCFHPDSDKFLLCSDWTDPTWRSVKSMRMGLDSDERHIREQVFDKNQIDVKEKSVPQLLMDEALHPFYIFQIASLILWSLDEYYYYAICIFLISVVSITTTLIETRSTMRRLREVSHFECDVRVLRNGFWRQITSSELVPGDVYEISDPNLTQFPCDGLLLAGDCIVNESMLTGESVPVSKISATDDSAGLLRQSMSTIHPALAKHFLFNGTKIIRARRPQEGQDDEAIALAMVVRTGFNTTKGALVRSMLFPKPSGFKFYRDAFRYISVMAVVAGIGFIASFVNFIRLELAWPTIIVRALDLITIVVPPALPATLTIGTNFALSRLKREKIFCISPQRVNVGGKLDVVCFDKTGTLTEDGLDVLGVRVVQKPAMRFSEVLGECFTLLPKASYERDPTVDYRIHQAILHTMATCHSLRSVEGELIGDPLDIKMFDFTGWSFEELVQKDMGEDDDAPSSPSSVVRPPAGTEYGLDSDEDANSHSLPTELGILKSFEFVSQLRRASVIVGQSGSNGGDVYVKGAPECMKDICHSDSLPEDYEDLLGYYTHRGYRVIACAAKRIESLDWPKVRRMTRQDAESNLNFLGFIIFENKLKDATTATIQELNEANIRSIMCTGDNILTAISVARECGLIDRTAHCFIPHFIEGDYRDPKARLKWQSVDNQLFELDSETLTPLPPPVASDASSPYDISNVRHYNIAISGDVFRWAIEYTNEEILKRVNPRATNHEETRSNKEQILVRGQVFARMSPDEKHELVEKLQSIDYCCGFCGDGANDCGALKAADVGISLSEAEASVAAPFTSHIFDISCVPEVIRLALHDFAYCFDPSANKGPSEGRAALVTSFCCFKYMSLYSAIQFTSVSFLYASASNLGDFQFLFIDIFLVLPVAIFMGWTGAYPTLCPKRPTASLVSRKVLTPLLGQIVICIMVQAIGVVLVRRQTWFIAPILDTRKPNIINSENTTLFGISTFQYIFSGAVLSVGPPFRQSMRNNLPFIVTIVAASLFSAYMLLDPGVWLVHVMQLTPMPVHFKVFILILALGGLACAWVAEIRVFPWLARFVGRLYGVARSGRRKKRKEYKLVLEATRI